MPLVRIFAAVSSLTPLLPLLTQLNSESEQTILCSKHSRDYSSLSGKTQIPDDLKSPCLLTVSLTSLPTIFPLDQSGPLATLQICQVHLTSVFCVGGPLFLECSSPSSAWLSPSSSSSVFSNMTFQLELFMNILLISWFLSWYFLFPSLMYLSAWHVTPPEITYNFLYCLLTLEGHSKQGSVFLCVWVLGDVRRLPDM